MLDFLFDDLGVGVDIERIDRFESDKITNSISFLSRVFTKNELTYCFSSQVPAQHLAARFAGKEAVFKALSRFGGKKLAFREIQIINDETGIPNVVIQREDYENINIIISLSHSKDLVIAFAVARRLGIEIKN